MMVMVIMGLCHALLDPFVFGNLGGCASSSIARHLLGNYPYPPPSQPYSAAFPADSYYTSSGSGSYTYETSTASSSSSGGKRRKGKGRRRRGGRHGRRQPERGILKKTRGRYQPRRQSEASRKVKFASEVIVIPAEVQLTVRWAAVGVPGWVLGDIFVGAGVGGLERRLGVEGCDGTLPLLRAKTCWCSCFFFCPSPSFPSLCSSDHFPW